MNPQTRIVKLATFLLIFSPTKHESASGLGVPPTIQHHHRDYHPSMSGTSRVRPGGRGDGHFHGKGNRGTTHSSRSNSNTALQCQLLGMNCAAPTDFTFSFKGFSMRGGCTDVHCHGWGLCLYEGRGIRAFHDPEPCSSSPIADMVSNHPMRTLNMIAHIR